MNIFRYDSDDLDELIEDERVYPPDIPDPEHPGETLPQYIERNPDNEEHEIEIKPSQGKIAMEKCVVRINIPSEVNEKLSGLRSIY